MNEIIELLKTAVAVLDEAIIQIITPMLKDAHILNGVIKQITPDKNKELFKIMQHPENVLAKMSELDKSLLVKELIENITVQCDNLEIKWTALAPDIIKSVLAGTQPADFILKRLIREEIPPIWAEQRKKYNFPEI